MDNFIEKISTVVVILVVLAVIVGLIRLAIDNLWYLLALLGALLAAAFLYSQIKGGN